MTHQYTLFYNPRGLGPHSNNQDENIYMHSQGNITFTYIKEYIRPNDDARCMVGLVIAGLWGSIRKRTAPCILLAWELFAHQLGEWDERGIMFSKYYKILMTKLSCLRTTSQRGICVGDRPWDEIPGENQMIDLVRCK
jgi:hypothetical protein